MTFQQLRIRVGLGIIAAHFGVLLLVGVLTMAGRYTQDELFMILGIIAPLFAAYSTIIIRTFLHEQAPPRQPLSFARKVLATAVPAIFVFVVVTAVLWKAFGSLTFDGAVKLIGAAETLLGAYVGMVVEYFFGRTSP